MSKKTSMMKWMASIWSVLLVAPLGGCGGGSSGDGSGAGLEASIYGPASWTTQTGFLNALDGSASSGGIVPLTYSWSIQSRPAGSTTRIDGADQAKAEIEPDVAGSYVIQLIVGDGVTSSQPAAATITASGPTTGWTRMGAVLDVHYGQDATNPIAATDSSGNPVVVWEETDPSSANLKNVYAKKWNGSSWSQLGNALDTSIADDVYQPVVAIDPTDDNPVVAWMERDGVYEVHVKKWNGSAWATLGGALNADITKDAFIRASIAIAPGGQIYVAWAEYTPDAFQNISDIFVKQWVDPAWVQLGTARDLDDIDTDPALAIDPVDGNPVLAWSQGLSNSGTYFGDMAVQKWDGLAWNALQADFSGGLASADTALAVGADGLPIVAWNETALSLFNVTVMKYDGAVFGGGYTTPYPASGSRSPALLVAAADDQPVLGFATSGAIFVKKWDDTTKAWTQYGSYVNYWSHPGAPSIAFGASGKIVTAWSETTNGKNVYVKIQQ